MFKKRKTNSGKSRVLKRVNISVSDDGCSDADDNSTSNENNVLLATSSSSLARSASNGDGSKHDKDTGGADYEPSLGRDNKVGAKIDNSKELILSNTSKDEATKANPLLDGEDEEDRNIKIVGDKEDDGVTYKGVSNYVTFLPKKDPKLNAVKISSNIKTTTVVDFQPDICKDFQQHGYCGYGDTCKFLHVRDNFKRREPSQVQDWEVARKNKLESKEKKKNKKKKLKREFLI